MAIIINPYISPRIITVLTVSSISIQELVNQVMEWEELPFNLTHERMLKAAGKQDLGGNVKVGITCTLLNARLKFEERDEWTTCLVYGGNLVAINEQGASIFPIEPSPFVTVALAQSSSATINSSDPELINAKLVAEHGDGSWQVGIEWEGI